MLESAQQLSAAPKAGSNWLAETWRLVKWDVFMVRRRTLAKVLLGILLGFYAAVLGIVLIINATAGDAATQQGTRDLLTFPNTLLVAGIYVSRIGPLLLCILAGALVGSEYNFGTLRLVLSRGTSRAQLLAAQVVTLALLALGTVGGMLLLSALVGVTLGPLLGGSLAALPAGGTEEILLYWLALSLQFFAYTLIALFFATLGRSIVAGIAFSLGYLFLEGIIVAIFVVTGTALHSDLGIKLTHVPDWLIGINTTGLIDQVGSSPLGFSLLGLSGNSGVSNPSAALPVGHTLPIILIYCAAFVGVSYWLLRRRDVTD